MRSVMLIIAISITFILLLVPAFLIACLFSDVCKTIKSYKEK